jgi:hypothetical protein
MLRQSHPEQAEALLQQAQRYVNARWETLEKMAKKNGNGVGAERLEGGIA